MANKYDVAVIGAGPAGSTAAHFLAQAGLGAVFLDKAEFPRDKTCGDGLTPRALVMLDELGVLHRVTQQSPPLNEIAITAPSGCSVTLRIPDLPHAPSYAAVLPRLQLDNLILEKAIASGAVFQGGVHVRDVTADSSGVTIKTNRGNVRARAAIVAVGASTRLLATIGLLPNPKAMIVAARAYFEDIENLPRRFQFRFDGVPLPGYGWLFPVSDSSANVGVGFLPSARRREGNLTALSGFEQFRQHSELRILLAGARQRGALKSFPIRTDFVAAPTYADRILLAGESAGLVNPLTGDGVDYALESGKTAAECLIYMFQTGDFSPSQFKAYGNQLRRQYQNLFRFCEQVQRFGLNARALNMLVPAAANHPKLASSLVNLVLGGKPAPESLSPLMLVRGLISNW